jgi:hypothetical protein
VSGAEIHRTQQSWSVMGLWEDQQSVKGQPPTSTIVIPDRLWKESGDAARCTIEFFANDENGSAENSDSNDESESFPRTDVTSNALKEAMTHW